MFILPALLSQGLLKTREVYQFPSNHYYALESIVLTIAFMALARIKNPEQLKQCKPGELGRILGLDRVPEVRCLREKIKLLTQQQQAVNLNNLLIQDWYSSDRESDADFLYIDGHVRIYYGTKANLPAKFISRQKLCLSATTEYWVNDAQGMPVMMIIGELTEKLQTAIEESIIPQLAESGLITLEITEATKVQCTFIFDREAYEPAFFMRLWNLYKIAIITYRKNVKDIWQEHSFKSSTVTVSSQSINMDLCEGKICLGGYFFREIRRLSESGHQTAIVTTHPTLETDKIAGRMFARWAQENFFRYLIYDYDFDKMISFGVEPIDTDKKIVNPEYRKVNHQLKKLREKIRRVEAKFYPIVEQTLNAVIDEIPILTVKQEAYLSTLDSYYEQEKVILLKRAELSPRISLAQMPEQARYNKLKTESKLLMNVIKMICYRAESAVASWISPFIGKPDDEKRMIVKQIIGANADIIPDYKNCTLTIVLHSLSANRYNVAVNELSKLLNETETVFPGTNLKLIFKSSAFSDCER